MLASRDACSIALHPAFAGVARPPVRVPECAECSCSALEKGMRRRELLALVGAFAGREQQRERTPRIGVLVTGEADFGPFLAAVKAGMAARGYWTARTLLFAARTCRRGD